MKILVLEVTALHLGFVGCYGNDWVATPNLDRLAAEGIVFDQHFADRPEPPGYLAWHQRSVATGRYVLPGTSPAPAAGFLRHESVTDLADFAPRVLRLLRRSDADALWIEGPALAPPWQLPADLLAVYGDEEADGVAALAAPVCGMRHVELEELEGLQSTYAAVVTFFDAQLGRILDRLRESDRLDELLLCVTATCGLPLGEHDLVGVTRPWLHDEFVHVPLIVRLPHAEDAGRRVAAFTQPLDLWPTLSAHLGEGVNNGQGCSLWPLMRGEVEQVRPYAVSALRMAGGEEWLLRTPDRVLVLPIEVPEGDPPRRPQLYVKPEDRWEVNDLSQRSEEEVTALQDTLHAFVAAARQPGPLLYPPLADAAQAAVEEAS